MLKLIPLSAAVLALCACSSAPVLNFPSGSATRQPINVAGRQAAAPAAVVATAGAAASKSTVGQAPAAAAGRSGKPTNAAEAPPEPVPLKVFMVNANERSTMEILRRWARVARVDFTWESDIDYPVTARMRVIHAGELEAALEQMRAALVGVRAPLTITSSAEGVVVQGGIEQQAEEPAAVVATKVESAAAAAPAEAMPAPAPAPAAVVAEPASRIQVAESRTSWPISDKKTLREVLDHWAALGGVKLVWESASNQALTEAARTQTYSGTFRESLAQLASNFGELATPIGMRFLDNGAVLRVYDVEQPK